MRLFAALALLAVAAAPAAAKPAALTIGSGESWTFSLYRGQPVNARRSTPSAKPPPGRIHVTVRSLMGTTMSISSSADLAYTYRAELVAGGKAIAARSCTLPAGGKLSFEHWPQQAEAVRLSDFRAAPEGGNCP